MACLEAYAEAWEYASFWCKAQLLVGAHEGAGPADVVLQNTTVNFLNAGAVANTGQILYNITQGTSGEIIGATANSLTATGVTWNAGDQFRSAFLSATERATIENQLRLVAGDISMVLSSVDACDCDYSAEGAAYLAAINIILARLFYDCPCSPTLSDEERLMYSELANNRLNDIRTGMVDPCGGTGSAWPLMGYAQQAWTEFAAADIIVRDILRNRTG